MLWFVAHTNAALPERATRRAPTTSPGSGHAVSDSIYRWCHGSASRRYCADDVQFWRGSVGSHRCAEGSPGSGRRSNSRDDSGLRSERQHHAVRDVHHTLESAGGRGHIGRVGCVDAATVSPGHDTVEAWFTDRADQRCAGADELVHVPMHVGRSDHDQQPWSDANPNRLTRRVSGWVRPNSCLCG